MPRPMLRSVMIDPIWFDRILSSTFPCMSVEDWTGNSQSHFAHLTLGHPRAASEQPWQAIDLAYTREKTNPHLGHVKLFLTEAVVL